MYYVICVILMPAEYFTLEGNCKPVHSASIEPINVAEHLY